MRVRKLMLFSLVVMLCFCFIVGLQALTSYRLAMHEAEEDAERLAHILSDHAQLTFLSVDLSLRRAVERQYFNALFGGNLPEYMEHNFSMWVRELPQISGMMLINENGYVEAASYEKGFESFSVSSNPVEGEAVIEKGKIPSEKDSSFSFTAGHKMGEPDSKVIVMSRKLSKLDGTYGGVVMAAIDPQYFVDFFDSISHGKYHFMSMTLADGTVMVSGPENTEKHGELLDALKAERDTLSEEDKSARTVQAYLGSNNKIYSTIKLGGFPVQISIALDSRDFLAFWKSNQLKDILFLTIFLLFGTALSLFAVTMERQIKRVQQSEASAVLASQTKSEFLANMSHEFRTPLNAINGFSEMLLSGYFGNLTAKQKERITDIHLCGNHLLQLISDILEFSKGEAGKLELAEEVVNLHETVEECTRMMREKLNSKKINLVVDVDANHLWVQGDKRKIRQILLNLLSNAFKFTPQSGSVTVASFLDDVGRLHLSVSDTGIGISEQDIPKALSVFGQVHRSQSLEGTGLGLPLCKIFAELHGGELKLQSMLGEGTTVEIILPHTRVLTAAQAEVLSQRQPKKPSISLADIPEPRRRKSDVEEAAEAAVTKRETN